MVKYAKYCCCCCCASHVSVPASKYIVQFCYIHAHAVSNTRRPHSVLIIIHRARCTHIFFCPHNTLVRVYVCSGSTCFRAPSAARSSIAWMAYPIWQAKPHMSNFRNRFCLRAKKKHPHHTPHTTPTPHHQQGNEIHVTNTNALVGRCSVDTRR